MILLIDNYDSFSYNLYQLIGMIRPDIRVIRNDEMTIAEIHKTVEDFGDAALRAKKAGFDGVELAGAHGYLLAQFLSPYYNDRSDEYGGSVENRCRIITEIISGIRTEAGRGFVISVRFPGDEFTPTIPGTLTVEDAPGISWICEQAGSAVLKTNTGLSGSGWGWR